MDINTTSNPNFGQDPNNPQGGQPAGNPNPNPNPQGAQPGGTPNPNPGTGFGGGAAPNSPYGQSSQSTQDPRAQNRQQQSPPFPLEPMALELEQCWKKYQRMKESAEALAKREGTPEGLADTAKEAAEEHYRTCVAKVLQRYHEEYHHQQEAFKGQYQYQQQAGPTGSGYFSQSNGFYRSSRDKMMSGVCGGLAEYFDMDSALIRVGFAIGTILSVIFPPLFLLPIAYVLLAILLPQKDGTQPCA